MDQGNKKVVEGANTLSSMDVGTPHVFQTPPPKDNSSVPNWFDLSVSKQISIVPKFFIV